MGMRSKRREQETFDVEKWFRTLDWYAAEELFFVDREQPMMQDRVVFENDPAKDAGDV
jgi:hypothetical protein